ncbi:L-glutamate gamma-semialdehyde dehydrogenase [Candidatus Formimonas warabiya]|uniref:L-glutamate gamma-semialdehyde dehydrogenase n=1 Tax=Formimonas warabiya TaxID=1761012 RepID=A0A3G1KTI4_FORW1|nr:L-glutamate gamma-semialdehyde dehydrogenase [Candidatus Formimonas warabiya]ATW25747.1 1-pyrroline-5-carboxylate dehydrogenase [Candidatus Formimonas warabiya]
MFNAISAIKEPKNEPLLSYAPGSPEKAALKKKLRELQQGEIEIPLIIGGKEVKTGMMGECIIPHKKNHVLARYHMAGEKEIRMAIEAAKNAQDEWEKMPWEHRASVFLKAAELLSGPWRSTLNGATMLGQSKTAHQAEIDSACELADFLRFNAYYLAQIIEEQPNSSQDSWNRLQYRPLEGFVFAITPFNFTAIGGNLPTAPALIGNTVLWKPASTAVYSNYFVMKLLQEAGLPDGVINFVPGSGSKLGNIVLTDENLAGIHFTGSTQVFGDIWRTVAENLRQYKAYPRIVGETGGKNFVFAHHSADVDALVTALIRGAYEYQGQKCSAASRAYVPQSIWPKVKERLLDEVSSIKVGDAENFTNFMSAVIDEKSLRNIDTYFTYTKASAEAEILHGGEVDDEEGFFVKPTVIVTTDPRFKTMEEEIFGPVLTIFVYPDNQFEKTIELCNETSPYGLTGAIFARDRKVISDLEKQLNHAASNFYINDKPTGAVVGQQPFGGSRASGTNDKAGSKLNLYRWINPRTIKENLNPPQTYGYSFMKEE